MREKRLEVQDWGTGFAAGSVAENCFGLKNIREWTKIRGGTLDIRSALGQGTVIRVEFPVVEAAATE